jgi:hypothetical protein
MAELLNKAAKLLGNRETLPQYRRDEIAEITMMWNGQLTVCGDERGVLSANSRLHWFLCGMKKDEKDKDIYEPLGIKFSPDSDVPFDNMAYTLQRKYQEEVNIFNGIRETKEWYAWQKLQECAEFLAGDKELRAKVEERMDILGLLELHKRGETRNSILSNLETEDESRELEGYKGYLKSFHDFLVPEIRYRKSLKIKTEEPGAKKEKGELLRKEVWAICERDYAGKIIVCEARGKELHAAYAKDLLKIHSLEEWFDIDKSIATVLRRRRKEGKITKENEDEKKLEILESRVGNIMKRPEFKKFFQC